MEKENPETVVFLDFGDHDFDQQQTIKPTKPGRTFWKKAYNVALDDLASLVAPDRVVICEGQPRTNTDVRNHSLDARCYESIFETEFPRTQFISVGGHQEVLKDKFGLAQAFPSLVEGLDVVRLVDRDDKSDKEVEELREENIRVLSLRNLESYLFDDEVLQALAKSVGKPEKAKEILDKKQSILEEKSTKHPSDNLKPASHLLYEACKGILNLTQCGDTKEAFMRDTLAPLIKPGTSVYDELKRNIFPVD